jgi:hypothetical protein
MVSSDNGGLEQSPIRNGKDKGKGERITDNTPLRGGKLKIFEGGIRIPFIIQGPGIDAGSVSETPINLIDMFPTYMAMAGAESKLDLDLDGCDVLPVMLGEDSEVKFADDTARDTLFWHYPSVMPSSSIIRKGGWKLRLNHAPEVNRLPRVMLYQLYTDDGSVCDIAEANNLADSQPAMRDELLTELNAWIAKYNAPKPYKNAHLQGEQRLAGSDQVPAVVKLQSVQNRVELHFETGAGKSKVVEAKLLYTTNGSKLLQNNPHQEEWFDISAEIKEGLVGAFAPPGMTHGIFYLRDENDFLITSESLPSYAGPDKTHAVGVEMIQDGYAYRPGLLSLINLAVSAQKHAQQDEQNVAALAKAIQSAERVVQTPVEETSYALAMRALRQAIKSLDVPQASLPVMNQFKTNKW